METKKNSGNGTGLPRAVAFGVGVGLLLILILTLVAAGLIWGGVIPPETPAFALSLLAGGCAFVGGRQSVRCSRGGTLIAGGLTGLILGAIMAAVCLGGTGGSAVPGPWLATLAALLAGGCLAGMGGRKPKKK